MNNTRPFDLAKLDTEGLRKRRRKTLLLWSLPVCIVALLVLLWIVALLLSTAWGNNAYKKGDYRVAAGHYGRLLSLNFVERYKMHYNQGTALLGAKDFAGARTALEQALDLGIPTAFECQVRVNLVLSIIGQAEASVANKQYDEAIVRYDDAKSVIDGRDCGIKLSSADASEETKQANSTLQQQRQQVTDRQNAAKQQRNGDDPGKSNTDEGDARDSSSPSRSQIDELQGQQQKNSERTYRTWSERGDYTATTSDRKYDAKNW